MGTGQLAGSVVQPRGGNLLTFLQLLLVHKASTGPSHNSPAVVLGNIFGNRNITAAEICTLPSLLIKVADETFICQGWMFS